jgi:hypothetical protein
VSIQAQSETRLQSWGMMQRHAIYYPVIGQANIIKAMYLILSMTGGI